MVSRKVQYSTDTTVSRQRDYVETEGDRAEVETMGEGSDVSQGSGEGTKGCGSTEEEDGEEESVGRAQSLFALCVIKSVVIKIRDVYVLRCFSEQFSFTYHNSFKRGRSL